MGGEAGREREREETRRESHGKNLVKTRKDSDHAEFWLEHLFLSDRTKLRLKMAS